MQIDTILSPERAVYGLVANSRKRAIELASAHLAAALADFDQDTELDEGKVYRALIEREKRGTTAIGKGVAIPHCQLDACKTIIGGLFILDTPVDFDALDDEPVNIMFVLLVPRAETTEHLRALAMLAERLDNASYRESLTAAGSNADLFAQAVLDPDQVA